jgi:hypothetical protein
MTRTRRRPVAVATRVVVATLGGALVVAALSSCSRASMRHGSQSPAPAPNAVSAAAALSSAGDPTAYAVAIAEVDAYLDAWSRQGSIKAAAIYNVAEQQAPTDAAPDWKDPLILVSGKVVDYRPYAWVSSGQFTLMVTVDLQFAGSDPAAAAWGNGRNSRFVTFTGPNAATKYRMSWATGP